MSPSLDELFLASCGVFGRWSLSVSGPKKVEKEPAFAVPYVLVGSRRDNYLRLKHPDVSRRHAYLQALPGGLFCVDLGSRLGLRFDDQDRLWGWLRTGQRLHVGPFTLALPAANQTSWLASSAWAPPDPIVDHPADGAPLAPVIGTLSDAGTVIAEWRMKRVVALVGRSQRCLVSVGHTSLSRLHCSLVRTPLGLWVVDLLSRTGTYLNGEPVRCARLREGDRLQVGKYVLRFWYQQSRPKLVVPIAVRSEAPAAPALEPAPEPPPPEADRAVAAPGKGRTTMLQTAPPPPAPWSRPMPGKRCCPIPPAAPTTRWSRRWWGNST
jgi:pSer/pThr/pTyr-binding forkhead associated (FHA) protein